MTGSYSRRPPLDGRVASTAHALVALSRIGKNVGVRKFGSARVDVRIQRKHDEKFLGHGDLPFMLAVADGAEVEVPAVYTGVLTTQSEKVTPRAART